MTYYTIKPAGVDHIGKILDIYAPVVRDSFISFETRVPEEAELASRITAQDNPVPWLVAECGATACGFAYASRYRVREAYQWSVEVSVYVHPDYHRQGIASALYDRLFLELAAAKFVNAYAVIAEPNPVSTGFHRSYGFVRQGLFPGIGFKQGAWRDVGWWHRLIVNRPKVPEPVVNGRHIS